MGEQLGKYELVRRLAMGGMAEVFLARAAGPGGFEKTLVVKRVLPHLVEDADFIEMFLREARLAARLDHPNVVQTFDFGEAEGAYYLAMEFVDGITLRTLLKRFHARGVRLPFGASAKLVSYACEGLGYAHDFADPETGAPLELVHRDVSADNLLLSRAGTVKVLDFGIAKVANQPKQTQTGMVKGKISYMPPEQLAGGKLDRRVDVYALGVVLYELIAGRKPFDATSDMGMMRAIMQSPIVPLGQRRDGVPAALSRIVDRALAKDRDQRYPDCRALQLDLERFIASTGEPVGPYELSKLVASAEAPSSAELPPAPVEPTAISPEPEPEPTAAPLPTGTFEPTGMTSASPGSWPARRGRGRALAGLGLLGVVVVGAILMLGRRGAETTRIAPLPAAPSVPRADVATAAVFPSASAARSALRADEATAGASAEKTPRRAPDEAAVLTSAVDTPTLGNEASPPPPSSAQEIARSSANEGPTPAPARERATDEPKEGAGPVRSAPTAPRRGWADFRVRPYAVVYVDGRKVGTTPLPPVALPAGRHEVRLENPELGQTHRAALQVKAGEAVVLKHSFLN